MKIVGLVLAGGQGRRLGGADKALLPLGTRPLIHHVLARLSPQVADVAISANGDPARFVAFGCAVLPDAEPDLGPLSGLLAGLHWGAAQGAGLVASVAVDTPFFPADLIARLAGGLGSGAVAMAESGGRLHPTCALWRVSLRDGLAAALAAGERRVAWFARAQGLVPVPFDAAPAFFNINDAADLATARAGWPG